MKEKSKNKLVKTKKISFISLIILFINIVFGLLLLLSNLAIYVDPEKFILIPLLGIVYPILLIINIFFILFWLLKFKLYFLISLIAIFIGFSNLTNTFSFKSRTIVDENIPKLKVISYNTRLLNYYFDKNNDTKNSLENIVKLLNEKNADIVCMQEYYDGSSSNINHTETIKKESNYTYHYMQTIKGLNSNQPFGLIVFSKHPIVNSEKIIFDNSKVNYAILCDILYNNDTIRIINSHLESNKFGKEDINFMNDLIKASNNEDFRKSTESIIKKIKTALIRRKPQVNTLLEIIKNTNYPIIFAGDLNDTPVSYTYKKFDNVLNDSFKTSGWNFGVTYAEKIPFLRIDYLFYSDHFEATNFETITNKISDHYPIISEFSLKSISK